MNKVTSLVLPILFTAQTAFAIQAPERNYVEGDGDLNFTCTQEDMNAKPHNTFDLTLMYDKNSPNAGLSMLSEENLASRNGDLVYKIEVTQLPFFEAEVKAFKQAIPGCGFAPMSLTKISDTQMEIYYECDADGDAGFGTLTLDMETMEVKGNMNFPEGQSDLLFPMVEDTNIKVNCQL